MAIRKRTNKEGKVTGWQVTVEGVRGPNGERKRFSKTLPTKKEAQAAELNMLNQLNNGGIQKAITMTTEDWVNTWLSMYNPDIEATTRRSYREKLDNYIIPMLGPIPLNNLDANSIQTMVKAMSNRGLAPRTIKNTITNLNSAMKKAIELRMISYNPCSGVVLPKIEAYNATVYDQREIQIALNAATGTDIYLLVLLGLSVGLRRGELDALKWHNIDLEKGLIHIVENRVCIKGKVIVKKPKSKSSFRTLAIGPEICDILRKAKEEHEERRAYYGTAFNDEDYVIYYKNGKPYHPDSLTQKWDRFMAKHNLKHIRLHDLRHTCATTMVENNVDPRTVKDRMGHASMRTTFDLYVHRTSAMDEKAANIMDKIICI